MVTDALNWDVLQKELKRFVSKKVGDTTLAEDIVHDVLLKVQVRIGQLKEEQKVVGWIYQITRNTVIDHYRRRSKLVQLKDIDWDSEPRNYNDCVSSCLQKILPTLPDKYRIPLEMTELGEMSQIEVAEKLNLSYTAAKARVQRARRMLRQRIDDILHIKTDGYGNVILCRDRKPCCQK